jgi:predicted ArsR family transcriptional regulator
MERHAATDAALAALAEPTRRRVYELVSAAPDAIGRDEVATSIGIGRPLAAFHLEKLVTAGLLSPEYRRLGGRSGPGAGRPAKLYRRSAIALDLSVPPRRYGLAAELFAEALAERGAGGGAGEERLLTIAAERGVDAGTAARASRGEAAWVESLAEAGYEPLVDAGEPSGRVRLRNCPYADVARDHRDVMCPANQAFLQGFATGFGRPDAAVLRLDRPDGGCCVTFEPAGPGSTAQEGVSQTG